ncbi:MAG: tail fiber protein [Bacteroidia bacterium]|nr:tail fiber protein [Bacteroidia bacterium]
MVIQQNGNVGIGTNAPLDKLHVMGAFSGAVTTIQIHDPYTTANLGFPRLLLRDEEYALNKKCWDLRIGAGGCFEIGDIDDAQTTFNTKFYISPLTGNIGINNGTPSTSAKLDVTSTTGGFAMPRMTSAQRKAIASPIDGLQVYDSNLKGIYIYDGTKWDCVSVPAGSVGYFANFTAPNGYLECNGQAVNRITYAELFTAIGTLYGVGDGSTTFTLPDLRGEFVRGVDKGRGVDAGRVIGSGQQSTAVGGYIQSDCSPSCSFGTYMDKILNSDGILNIPGSIFISHSGTGGGGAGFAFPADFTGNTYSKSTIRPRNIAMLPCIKF